jgi:hypothetical protein
MQFAVTGGIDSRRAVQGVRLKAGIVGHRDASAMAGHSACLEERIFLKAEARFFHLFHLREGVQAENLKAECTQSAGQLTYFSGIAGSQNNFRRIHVSFPFLQIAVFGIRNSAKKFQRLLF